MNAKLFPPCNTCHSFPQWNFRKANCENVSGLVESLEDGCGTEFVSLFNVGHSLSFFQTSCLEWWVRSQIPQPRYVRLFCLFRSILMSKVSLVHWTIFACLGSGSGSDLYGLIVIVIVSPICKQIRDYWNWLLAGGTNKLWLLDLMFKLFKIIKFCLRPRIKSFYFVIYFAGVNLAWKKMK